MSQPVPTTEEFPGLPPEYYQPRQQPWFQFDGDGHWQEAASESAAAEDESADWDSEPVQKVRVLTWNIDAMIPFDRPRMAAALKHLESMVSSPPAPFTADTPAIILLQEMRESDLDMIQETPWIQKGFTITDVDSEHWPTSYGTTMLIDRRLTVANVFRVPWVSRFGRDGLFVDIHVPVADDRSRRLLRVCNTHLESLPSDQPIRPKQVAAAAEHLHAPEVHGAVLAGDMNAIQPSDRHIAAENKFKDAYLELGGVEDADEGFTWGYQCAEWMRLRFGCSRMDKVFYSGGFAARQLTRIGVDVRVEEEDVVRQMQQEGLGGWVTDHYGLMAELEILPERGST
ncbi:hypothetical protein VTO42DRAFT_6727 [Malbranchea cinnamomea]